MVLGAAAAVLGGCGAGEPAPAADAGPVRPAPLLYPEFGARFAGIDNLHEACRSPSPRCAHGVAAVGELTNDLQAAIEAHPSPGVYAEVTRVLSRVEDTVRRSPGGGCAIEIHPVDPQLCAAQGTMLFVDVSVAHDELRKVEGVDD